MIVIGGPKCCDHCKNFNPKTEKEIKSFREEKCLRTVYQNRKM